MTRVATTFAIATLFAAQMTQGQGTLYVSNLGQGAIGSPAIGSDKWEAQFIETGNNSGGYLLNSIQLLMNASSGSPSGFTVSIYSDVNNTPSSDLENLSGSSNPSSGGLYTYTASGLLLSPSTQYFIVAIGATSMAQGAYTWDNTFGSPAGINQWAIQEGIYSLDNGLDWTVYGRNITFQSAIYATAVPEPSTWVLGLLGGGFAFYLHARKQPKQA